jgi:phospholipase/carboxylesterase
MLPEIAATGIERASMLWLHGLGAPVDDLLPLAEALALPGIRHVFACAPVRRISLYAGQAMPAWYDLRSRDFFADADDAGIAASRDQVLALRAELGTGPVFLGGFSQGAVITAACALTAGASLAGAVMLSGYVPPCCRGQTAPTLPFFLTHGQQDEIIPPVWADDSLAWLEAAGARVASHRYACGHTVTPEMLADLRRWLAARLADLT